MKWGVGVISKAYQRIWNMQDSSRCQPEIPSWQWRNSFKLQIKVQRLITIWGPFSFCTALKQDVMKGTVKHLAENQRFGLKDFWHAYWSLHLLHFFNIKLYLHGSFNAVFCEISRILKLREHQRLLVQHLNGFLFISSLQHFWQEVWPPSTILALSSFRRVFLIVLQNSIMLHLSPPTLYLTSIVLCSAFYSPTQ